MAESCIEQIEIQSPNLRHFIAEVQKHGNILTLNELYARDQKQSNEIILVSTMKLRVFENKGNLVDFTAYSGSSCRIF
jgi:hypothetical protein